MNKKPSTRQQIKTLAVRFVILWIIIVLAISYLIPNHPYYDTILGVVIVSGIISMFVMMNRLDKSIDQKKQALLQKGTKAKAKVISIGQEIKQGDYHFIVSMKIEVMPEDKSSFTTEVETMVPLAAIPRPGDEIMVVYDPQNQTDIAVL